MADATSTLYLLVEPEVGASADTWGSKLNTNFASIDKLLGAITTTGSANAYVLTSGQSLAAYANLQRFCIKANFTNTGAATINVDGLGAKALTKNGTTALASGDIVSGQFYVIAYDGTQFQVLGALSGAFQTLNANLTALAGQTWAADQITYQTGAAAVASLAFPSASRTQIAAGLGTAATVADSSLVHTTGAENIGGAKTFTATAIISNTLPILRFDDTDGGTNQRYTSLYNSGTTFNVDFSNDALNAGTTVMQATRSGISLTALSFGIRPSFNGNTALDTNNGAQLGAANTFTTGPQTVSGTSNVYWACSYTGGPTSFFQSTSADTSLGNTSANGGGDVVVYSNSLEIGRFSKGGGFTARTALSSETSGTLTSASSNKIVVTTAGVTINDGIHAANDQILIYNNSASPITITQDTGMTLRLDGTTTTGNRTLGVRGKMHVFFETNSEAICSGMGVS